MSILVTGADGFLGQWVMKELVRNRLDVFAWNGPQAYDNAIDLLDRDRVLDGMKASKPRVVLHLAGASSVAQSWQDPGGAIAINVLGTLNLWQAARETNVDRFIYVSSAEVYAVDEKDIEPIKESRQCDPRNPYATSKHATEQLLGELSAQSSTKVVILRPFNIVGPGQRAGFVLTDFAREIIRVKKENRRRLLTGNLDVIRDFLDVRDAVRAYRLLCTENYQGNVFNICSGIGRPLQDGIQAMLHLAGLPQVDIQRDSSKYRPNDRPVLIGNRSALSQAIDWVPTIPWELTLTDILAYEDNNRDKL